MGYSHRPAFRRISSGAPGIGRGFTLAELVMVLVITAILAVAAIPFLSSRLTFDTRSFTDQVRAALQYAQSVAVAHRTNVCATITANSFTLTQAASAGSLVACTAPLIDPTSGSSFVLSTPGSVSFPTPVTITFDALGQTASAVTVTIRGDSDQLVNVEAVTGYVR